MTRHENCSFVFGFSVPSSPEKGYQPRIGPSTSPKWEHPHSATFFGSVIAAIWIVYPADYGADLPFAPRASYWLIFFLLWSSFTSLLGLYAVNFYRKFIRVPSLIYLVVGCYWVYFLCWYSFSRAFFIFVVIATIGWCFGAFSSIEGTKYHREGMIKHHGVKDELASFPKKLPCSLPKMTVALQSSFIPALFVLPLAWNFDLDRPSYLVGAIGIFLFALCNITVNEFGFYWVLYTEHANWRQMNFWGPVFSTMLALQILYPSFSFDWLACCFFLGSGAGLFLRMSMVVLGCHST